MNSSREELSSVAALVACLLVSMAQAQSPGEQPDSGLHSTAKGPGKDNPGVAPAWTGDPDKHPLTPALRWAKEALQQIQQVDNYTATLIKRERSNGRMGPTETLAIKIRQKPLSIYVKSLGPQSMKGQEVLYVDGANDGKMWAHSVGLRGLLGTLAIDPTDPLAMQGQQYPITQIGILKLTERLIEVADRDRKFGECTAKWLEHVKINDRTCRCIEVVHPQPRDNFLFHVARIFVDDELNLPIRYERYDWPSAPGGRLPLMEEYTYLDVRRNAGLTAADFDVRNPAYHFRPADRVKAGKSEPHGTH
jgi:hypothetical protein